MVCIRRFPWGLAVTILSYLLDDTLYGEILKAQVLA